jgi:hypothetical protein
LLLLLAVVPKHNRNRQAWLILLLPLPAVGFTFLIQVLFSESSVADNFGHFVVALAIAWASVWLMGPWLQYGNRVRRLLYTCGVMFAVGAVGYLGFFGVWVSSDVTWLTIGLWAVCSVSLIAATALTGLCCRGDCNSLRLLFWPMLWMPVVCALCVSVLMICVVMFQGGLGVSLLDVLVIVVIQGVISSVLVAGLLYFFDLPVILLHIFSPLYRERFRGIFCCSGPTQTAETVEKLESKSVGQSPFGI